MFDCTCDSWQLQKEKTPGEFHDPDDRLPRDKRGLKTRVLHFGCTKHLGHTNRKMPPNWPLLQE
jgi:hypothetical protein